MKISIKFVLVFMFWLGVAEPLSVSAIFHQKNCENGTLCDQIIKNDSDDQIEDLNSYLKDILSCDLCLVFITLFRTLINENKIEKFSSLAIFICYKLKIEDKTICSQTLETYKVKNFQIYQSLGTNKIWLNLRTL